MTALDYAKATTGATRKAVARDDLVMIHGESSWVNRDVAIEHLDWTAERVPNSVLLWDVFGAQRDRQARGLATGLHSMLESARLGSMSEFSRVG
jgi:hypothetical protein